MFLDFAATQNRYCQLADALRPFHLCWNQSILQHWSSCSAAIPKDWLHSIDSLSHAELFALDEAIGRGHSIDAAVLPTIAPSLRLYLDKLSPLLACEKFSEQTPLARQQGQRMSEKKQHEIEVILAFARQQMLVHNWQSLVDIGGGAGHLARILQSYLHLPTLSIDQNAELQSLGRRLLTKAGQHENPEALHFIHCAVERGPQQAIDHYFQPGSLSLGLHTCGPLALVHFEKSKKARSLLNFGCCYDRLNVDQDCQLSGVAQDNPLPMSRYALFLATRGRQRSANEMAFAERVNGFRFALNGYLRAEGVMESFTSVGDAPRADYRLDFATYAEGRFAHLGLLHKFDRQRAELYGRDPEVLRSMREFFLCNVLRNCFARPIELSLLLDRVLFLMEQGRSVALLEFFRHSLSPRNLGIFAS